MMHFVSFVSSNIFHSQHNKTFKNSLPSQTDQTFQSNFEWPRQNFSLQYQYNSKETSNENKEKYQLGDYKLIQYQILQTDITRTV